MMFPHLEMLLAYMVENAVNPALEDRKEPLKTRGLEPLSTIPFPAHESILRNPHVSGHDFQSCRNGPEKGL
jgi:hypothetical protein